jgi:hypothetical protein
MDGGKGNQSSYNNQKVTTETIKNVMGHQADVAYSVGAPASASRQDKIRRDVQSLLNKIAPENLDTIVDRMAEIQLVKHSELEMVIQILYRKALDEPHYSETYADMVFALKNRYPEFPSETDPTKNLSFHRDLLNVCQNEFEQLSQKLEVETADEASLPQADRELVYNRKKKRAMTNMKFIGQLFLRQLLSIKVITSVIEDLMDTSSAEDSTDGQAAEAQIGPAEYKLECVCELLTTVGYTLEGISTTSQENNKERISHYLSKLAHIRQTRNPKTGSFFYSKRIQFAIQDLIDLRKNEWRKKVFKEGARKRDEFDGTVDPNEKAKLEIAGARPDYIDDIRQKHLAARAHQQDGLDEDELKRMVAYYAEDENDGALKQSWTQLMVSADMAVKGAEFLMGMASEETSEKRQAAIASIIYILTDYGHIKWPDLARCLRQALSSLPDQSLDYPNAYVFFVKMLVKVWNEGKNPLFLTNIHDEMKKLLDETPEEDPDMRHAMKTELQARLRSLQKVMTTCRTSTPSLSFASGAIMNQWKGLLEQVEQKLKALEGELAS